MGEPREWIVHYNMWLKSEKNGRLPTPTEISSLILDYEKMCTAFENRVENLKAIMSERDNLRAENERLRSIMTTGDRNWDMLESDRNQLRAENEELKAECAGFKFSGTYADDWIKACQDFANLEAQLAAAQAELKQWEIDASEGQGCIEEFELKLSAVTKERDEFAWELSGLKADVAKNLRDASKKKRLWMQRPENAEKLSRANAVGGRACGKIRAKHKCTKCSKFMKVGAECQWCQL